MSRQHIFDINHFINPIFLPRFQYSLQRCLNILKECIVVIVILKTKSMNKSNKKCIIKYKFSFYKKNASISLIFELINLVFELLYFLCLFLILNKQRTDHLFDIFLLKMKLVDHLHVHVLEPLFDQRSQFLHLKTLYSSGYYIYWFLLAYCTFNLRYLFIRHWFWYGILTCLWREV